MLEAILTLYAVDDRRLSGKYTAHGMKVTLLSATKPGLPVPKKTPVMIKSSIRMCTWGVIIAVEPLLVLSAYFGFIFIY